MVGIRFMVAYVLDVRSDTVLTTLMDCRLRDVEILFTMPNRFDGMKDVIRAQITWALELGKVCLVFMLPFSVLRVVVCA